MREKMPGCILLWIMVLLPLVPGCGQVPGRTERSTEAIATPRVAQASTLPATPVLTPVSQTLATATSTLSPVPGTQATATSVPSLSPTTEPSATAQSRDEVLVRETSISIASYPYERYLREGIDAEHGVPYLWLDRAAYGEPAGPLVPRSFRAVVLENRYLQLTILPDLGGRIYECIFKPTGQDIFYRNEVLKPTHWGPLSREQNWWLAAGGMEWAFPVQEHGYEWGLPWSYSVHRSGLEAVVTVRDSVDTDRPRVSVEIGLRPGKSYFTIRPRIENPTAAPISYQYWTNAMLTLGGRSMSPNTEFVYPAQEVIIHSTGPRSDLPEGRTRIDWPRHEGRDMAWYYNWVDWLGFFIPHPTQDFVGAYNHDTGLGVARIFPRQEVPGTKLYAHGLEFAYAGEYTDDGSQYFEIWGGPNPSFWPADDAHLAPGENEGWTEYWYPFWGIGGLDFANGEAALSLQVRGGSLALGIATTSQQEGIVVLAVDGEELHREVVAMGPESPHVRELMLPVDAPATAGVALRFLSPEGQVIAEYRQDMRLSEQ